MVVSPGFRSEMFSVTIRAIAYARKEDVASKVTYFMSVQCTLIIVRLIRLRFSLLLNFSSQLHQRIHLRFLLEGGSPKRNGVADWCKRMRRRLHLRVRGKGSAQPLHPPTPPPPPPTTLRWNLPVDLTSQLRHSLSVSPLQKKPGLAPVHPIKLSISRNLFNPNQTSKRVGIFQLSTLTLLEKSSDITWIRRGSETINGFFGFETHQAPFQFFGSSAVTHYKSSLASIARIREVAGVLTGSNCQAMHNKYPK